MPRAQRLTNLKEYSGYTPHGPVSLGAGTNPRAMLAGQVLTIPLFTLTDYQNIVVVDSAGNGDYTTLAAAMAAIVGAGPGNRYLVVVFGDDYAGATMKDYVDITGIGAGTQQIAIATGGTSLTEPPVVSNVTLDIVSGANDTAITVKDCVVLAVTISHTNVHVNMESCRGIGSVVVSNGKSIVLDERDCHFVCGIGSALSLRGTATIRNCYFSSLNDYTVHLPVAATLILYNTVIENNKAGGGAAIRLSATGSTLYIYGGKYEAQTANGYGLYITMTPAAMLADHATFASVTAGRAIAASGAYANAPLVNCTFVGGQTNIACAAGTANGTCVEV